MGSDRPEREYIEKGDAEVRHSSDEKNDEMYNPEGSTVHDPSHYQSEVCIPVFDEPVQVDEAITQMNNMKPNKPVVLVL